MGPLQNLCQWRQELSADPAMKSPLCFSRLLGWNLDPLSYVYFVLFFFDLATKSSLTEDRCQESLKVVHPTPTSTGHLHVAWSHIGVLCYVSRSPLHGFCVFSSTALIGLSYLQVPVQFSGLHSFMSQRQHFCLPVPPTIGPSCSLSVTITSTLASLSSHSLAPKSSKSVGPGVLELMGHFGIQPGHFF